MNLQENIIRIKEVMGVINEQTEKVIDVVKGSFTAKDCDELHAFESTCKSNLFDKNGECVGGTTLVGEMHTKMLEKLNALYENGHNPKVSNVGVIVNGNTVSWECTIVESADGKAWLGFTSRGAGCNNDIVARATSSVVGNDLKSLIGRINAKYGEPDIEIKKAKDYTYDGGGNSFRQIFYIYTRPKKYPPHTSSKKSKPVISVVPDSTKNKTIIKPEPLKTKPSEPVISVAPDSLKNDTIIKQEPLKIKALETTPNAIVAVANTIKRPDGDPYTYAKTASGDYLTYRCGKNKPCPDNINWINVTQGVRDNKKDYTTYESAIKTNIFQE